ncbi:MULTISPECIES: hypothetical protein [Cyanophyceae]|uniref:hypothetical protein n=1 Tax=Cyanophyceae TaxID=3028117 RepID=UPI0002F78FB4|nr:MULTISPECIES: hypothetical protein [Cyanophyceae]SMH33656.1 hypothetical protein SAMN06272755_0478 [Picosynechococcus sp. OG1]SMQ84432.1 hypothetical protein SAMN06272774_2854 [Synechococcus sp. 7002]
MDSSGSPGKPADPSPRWSDLLGTAIALLTLTIPLLIIGYYSDQPVQNLAPDLTSSVLLE